jgi:Holliday junction resolvase
MTFENDCEQLLLQLNDKYGTTQLGKICQCIMVLALHGLKWNSIRNHISEDADIDVIDGKGSSYSFELKTTAKKSIIVQQKDISCLRQRAVDGYAGYFLALRIGPQTQWFAVPYDSEGIGTGDIPFARLRLHDDSMISGQINMQFQTELRKYFPVAMQGGLTALLASIAKQGIETVG